MSAGAPWSVKGIDPKAREVAKDLARRSGMTLGAWLNRVILEDDLPEEIGAEEDFAGHRMPEPPRLRALPGGAGEAPPPDLGRVAAALDRLTLRIEASETRTGLAINGVEHSVRQALARIETNEREQHALAARLEGGLAEAAAEQSYVGERLRRLEDEPAGPRSPEALWALDAGRAAPETDVVAEAVLARLGERLVEAEARTTAALEDLKFALGALDHRLVAVERGGGEAVEARFGALAQDLTRRVEAARAEVAGRLAQAGGGGDVEARLAEMAEHVRAAERRSTAAVEAIGKQVLAMADAVSRKLTEVDQRGAAAIDQVGSEIARIAGAVELRLARGEQVQAQAFEKITADFTRATEALTERLSAGEQRNAHAIEAVGDQVAALTERIEARHDRAASDVAERLRQSEARTADLLDQARTWIRPVPEDEAELEEDLSQAWSRSAPEAAAAERVLGPPPEPEPEPVTGPFGDELYSRAEPEPADDAPARPETVAAAWRRLDLDVPEPETPQTFAPIAGDEDDDDDIFAPDPADPPPALGPQLSTREVIEQARAAARAAKVAEGAKAMNMRASLGGQSAGRLFTGFGGGKPRRANTALQTALMVAGGAAFLSVGAAGITLMQGPREEQAEVASVGAAPRAAVALASPGLTAPGQAADAIDRTPPVFARVRADVEAGVPGAMAQLRALAAAGHAQAQLYLAQLYDAGEAGLPQDPVEARRLTALAADSGDAKAMHNLGVYLFRGEGGPADFASAAEWFRKAAAAGVIESQYNLGLLYQSGSGVAKDPQKARHWFATAAARGDADARRALADLDSQRAAAPAAPPAVRRPAAAPTHAAVEPASSPNVRQAQAILTRLGYYEGPADGHASEAYKVALFRYQQDQRTPRP